MASRVRKDFVDKMRTLDKKKGWKGRLVSASSGGPGEEPDRQPEDAEMEDTQISDGDEADEASASSADDVDLSIARLIQKTAKFVGKECEVRWEKRVSKMIHAEAANTAVRFEKERRDTMAQLEALEGKLMAEIKASRALGARSSASTEAGSSRESTWLPRKVAVKGWVVNWEDRFNTGPSPEETDKWLELF